MFKSKENVTNKDLITVNKPGEKIVDDEIDEDTFIKCDDQNDKISLIERYTELYRGIEPVKDDEPINDSIGVKVIHEDPENKFEKKKIIFQQAIEAYMR